MSKANVNHWYENARFRSIRPPHLDPDNDFPSTDCEHDDVRELFFAPDVGRGEVDQSEQNQREQAARRVCAGCPFIVECALHGLRHEEYGVWGGLAESDRSALGGRGISGQGGPKRVETTVRRLSEAGVPLLKVKAILRRWAREKTEGRVA